MGCASKLPSVSNLDANIIKDMLIHNDDETWKYLSKFGIKYKQTKDNKYFPTNIEIIEYLKALDNLKYSADCEIIYNPSAISIWISFEEKIIEIKPSETIKLKERE